MFEKFLENIVPQLSDRPTRAELANVTKLFKPRTLANLDSMGKGPGGVLYGKCIRYEKEKVIEWLRQYLEKNALRNSNMKAGNGGTA